jgi:uncharacterized protein YijF (DUF1287 family)
MTPVLEKVIAAICRERDGRFDETFRLVDQLLTEYGEDDLANRLVNEIPRKVPFEIVTELLDILSWSASEKASIAIGRTREQWLRDGTDTRKLMIALHGESYPFIDQGEMESVLARLAHVNSDVSGRCLLLIEQRRKDSRRQRRHRRLSNVRRLLKTLGLSTVLLIAPILPVMAQSLPPANSAESRRDFLHRFVAAAVERTHHTVRYDSAYVRIAYPGGDVPETTGVCTDEVIRAYRAVGVDLQKDVHEDMAAHFSAYPTKWHRSSPDPNIDHRRVPNLMVFFSRKGEVLPITDRAEDYVPGDLVTWDLGHKQTHIGIVVDQKALFSRRYMIVHNIGTGPRMEDVLFDWKIIGHYRYFGR